MKGIVLAGGTGSRLFPLTASVSKQLLPVYDKPMIFYPLSVLMLGGIRDILVITTPQDKPLYQNLLGSGREFGVNITYATQKKPEGLAQAFVIAEDFIESQPVCLVLGDNIFFGHGLSSLLSFDHDNFKGAKIFACRVSDPGRFGVVGFDGHGKVNSIEEKPDIPKSNFAVTGLYYYDSNVVEIAKSITPSSRNELEISSVNQIYLEKGELEVVKFNRGIAWLDTGTPDSLIDASKFVHTVETLQGLKIACLEEIAWRQRWISNEALLAAAQKYSKSGYGSYLLEVLKEAG